jgi:DNA-binding transcriptional LysR family regulator
VLPLFPGEALAIALAAGHPLAARAVLTPEDLAGECVVISERAANPAFYDLTQHRLEAAGYRFAAIHPIARSDIRDLVIAVSQGRGVGFVPSSLVHDMPYAMIAVRRIEPPLAMPDTVVAWRAGPPAELVPVIDAIAAVAAGLRAAHDHGPAVPAVRR